MRVEAVTSDPRRSNRTFYPAMATILAALIFAGFTRSFYARGWSPSDTPLALPVFVHGVAGTLFVVAFAVQSWLVTAGRVAAHRKLGVAAALLAVLLVGSGIAVTVHLERGHSPEASPVFVAHVFANAVPLASFAILAAAGIWQRRTAARHKRLMLMAAVVLLPPGTGRLFAQLGVEWLNIPVYACAASANAVYDLVTTGRAHALSVWPAAALIVIDIAITWWLRAVGA
jgi:hypothetical protein